MKTFECVCGNRVHFENSRCIACGRPLGFLPDCRVVSALEPSPPDGWRTLHPAAEDKLYTMCHNYEHENVCNWMVPAADANQYCASCRLNRIIPNLGDPKNRTHWYHIETAKRRLLYTLLELGLPIVGKSADGDDGLAFQFLADTAKDTEFFDSVSSRDSVRTGHLKGTITINIAEANPSEREKIREKMNELYRTLLGHFRHEIGHYYWNLLVRPTQWLEPARQIFGDERNDYDTALANYYANGAPADWQRDFISAYASAHPWEDWAETWAHYMHMVDTLETAHDFGFFIDGREVLPPRLSANQGSQWAQSDVVCIIDFDSLLNNWIDLTIAMNALNRSMGLPDAYPFALSGTAINKLRFVHRLIYDSVPPA